MRHFISQTVHDVHDEMAGCIADNNPDQLPLSGHH
jgi:hypothetical protein